LRVRHICLRLKRDIINAEYIRQLVRAAGSVAGNYIEANENLGDADLRFRVKVCRKESKESRLWLRHILTYDDPVLEKERLELIEEATELEKIFAAILRKLMEKGGNASRRNK